MSSDDDDGCLVKKPRNWIPPERRRRNQPPPKKFKYSDYYHRKKGPRKKQAKNGSLPPVGSLHKRANVNYGPFGVTKHLPCLKRWIRCPVVYPKIPEEMRQRIVTAFLNWFPIEKYSRKKILLGRDPTPVTKGMSIMDLVDIKKNRREIARNKRHDLYEVLVHFAFPAPEDQVLAFLVIWKLRDRYSNVSIGKLLKIDPKLIKHWSDFAQERFWRFVKKHEIPSEMLNQSALVTEEEQREADIRELLQEG